MNDMKPPRLAARAAPIKYLRKHQIPAVARVKAALAGERRPSDPSGTMRRRVGLDLAVAFGKTVTNGHIIRELLLEGQRALYLVDRDALVQQAVDDLNAVLTDVTVGVVQGDRNEVWADVIVAMVQTIQAPHRREQIKDVALIIADECHGSAARTWRETLEYFGVDLSDNPSPDSTPLIGCTGTMVRSDDKILVGEGGILEEVVHKKTILDGIREKWLVDPKIKRVRVAVDYAALVQESHSDKELHDATAGALVNADAGNSIADAIYKFAVHPNGKLGQGLIYVSRVSAAHHISDTLNERGLASAVVSAKTPKAEFIRIMQDLDAGRLNNVVNVGKLTTGFDKRYLYYVVVARPTKSQGLFIQIVGRILRLSPETGKTSALVLDVVGVTEGMGLVTADDVFGEVRDGETLGEAAERRELELPDDLEVDEIEDIPDEIEGDLVAEDVDPFGASTSVWLQTYEGMWFIPTELAYFYLWPRSDGKYNVRKVATYKAIHRNPERRRDSVTLERSVDFEDAMDYAVKYAESADPKVARKNAAWRRKDTPTLEQMSFLCGDGKGRRGIGAVYGEHFKTRNEASNLISQYWASQVLDV